MKGIAFLAFFASGLMAFAGAIAGFKLWLGVSTFVAVLAAVFSVWFPPLTIGVSFYGMTEDWGWHWYWAALLMFWPLMFAAIGALVLTAFDRR